MSEYYGVTTPTDDFLAHYGVKGMKWGVKKAIAKGSDRALRRQYQKAAKKLATLERQAASGKKYTKRAVALGAGAAAAGGLAAAGTGGVSRLVRAGGSAVARGNRLLGGAMSKAGQAMHDYGRAPGGRNSFVKKAATRYGNTVKRAGEAVSGSAGSVSRGARSAATAVSKWGNSKSIASQASNALGGVQNGTVQNLRKNLANVSNNTIARIGAGAVGAGLAAGAGYNAYRAATTKKAAKKAQQFRSEMNKAFAGTKYANGNPTRNKKKNRNGKS